MKYMGNERYITDTQLNIDTHDELRKYLDDDPYPEYRLVSVLKVIGGFLFIWELNREALK